ncbi:hypothetical protein QBE52_08385 [Clostridiaceae bacterium 35-E11]
MNEFIRVPYIESLIGYANEVLMNDNLEQIRFNSRFEMQLTFSDETQTEKYIIVGMFKDKELLQKEAYKGSNEEFLLGNREDMLSVLIMNETKTQVLEYEMKAYKQVKEMMTKMVKAQL